MLMCIWTWRKEVTQKESIFRILLKYFSPRRKYKQLFINELEIKNLVPGYNFNSFSIKRGYLI
jgi:hypothetical protein